jgi:hypothetical protein
VNGVNDDGRSEDSGGFEKEHEEERREENMGVEMGILEEDLAEVLPLFGNGSTY